MNFFSVFTGSIGCLNATMGVFMFCNVRALSKATHGQEITDKILPEDNILVQSTERLVGVVLASLGFTHLAMSSVTDPALQLRFAIAGLVSQSMLLSWRLLVERRLDAMKHEWKGQAVGDILFGSGWLYILWSSLRK